MSAFSRTQIVSHRGGAFLWPENSLEAFRQTLALGVEQAECDVHLSADGVPVVIHDATLQRTTEARGPVAAQDAATLRGLRLRGAGSERLPDLASVAALFRGRPMQLQVELKTDSQDRLYDGLLPKVLAVVEAAGIRAQTRIIAFEAEVAAAALASHRPAADGMAADRLAGAIWLFEAALLLRIGAEGIVGVARAQGLDMVETDIGTLDAPLLASLRGAGLRVGVWGANHAASMRKAFEMGVDSMATDDPVLALQLRV